MRCQGIARSASAGPRFARQKILPRIVFFVTNCDRKSISGVDRNRVCVKLHPAVRSLDFENGEFLCIFRWSQLRT